jgi:pilus assembly protein Flp/PilA
MQFKDFSETVFAIVGRTRQGLGSTMLKKFLKDDSGATAIEYGLIAAIMAVALITGFGTLSGSLSNQMTYLANTMNDAWN